MKCHCGTGDSRQHTHLCDVLNDRDREIDRLRAIEEAAREFLPAAEAWDACISPQDDEGHSLREYVEARERLRLALGDK